MAIGIILLIAILIIVITRVYMEHGCFFKPMFRDDVYCYAREHGRSDDETIDIISRD